jgi:SUMO ligase MMS21 Smc5/6 complex component
LRHRLLNLKKADVVKGNLETLTEQAKEMALEANDGKDVDELADTLKVMSVFLERDLPRLSKQVDELEKEASRNK